MTRPTSKKSNSDRPPSPVRIKFYPPTIEEAVAAVQDIAEDVEGQVEVAAGLMGVDPADVRTAVLAAFELKQQAKRGERVVVRDRAGSERAVVVQRAGRRPLAAPVTVERTRAALSGRLSLPGRVRVFDLTRSG